MPATHVVPSIDAKSFSCPHCGALADQSWLLVRANQTKDGALPHVWDADALQRIKATIKEERNAEKREALKGWLPDIERRAAGLPYLYHPETGEYAYYELANVFVSRCFSCKDIAIWKHDNLLYPTVRHEVESNPDLNPDIRADFDEARAVFSTSPRASAALLRLCLQKLCKQLGQSGKKIDDDIGAWVAKGLPIAIQQALDLVRVVGNNAVHPGTINLNDDRATAAKLFELVNLIAENQITQPKAIAKLFDEKLTPGAKDAIARRDGAPP